MRIIKEPKGKALEYAPLSLNLYNSCRHACKYCYCPRQLHTTKQLFHHPRRIVVVKDLFDRLEKDCKHMQHAGDDREICLTFTGDCYQPDEMELGYTRRCIEMLIRHGLRFTILTKGGTMAVKDFDLLEGYDKCSFGSTVTFMSQNIQDKYEENSALIEDRMDAIYEAHKRGIKTWISVEPVLDFEEAIEVVKILHRNVGHWKVGKINYYSCQYDTRQWIKFRDEMIDLLKSLNADYYIKKSLTELSLK